MTSIKGPALHAMPYFFDEHGKMMDE